MKRNWLIRRLLLLVSLTGLAAVLYACDGNNGSGGSILFAVSATIGPEGGAFTSRDGMVTITVPAGALSSEQTLSIFGGSPGDVGGLPVDAIYELRPEGLTFAVPVIAEISLTQRPSTEVSNIAAALIVNDENSELLSQQTLRVDLTELRTSLSGRLSHFSKLAIKQNIPASAGFNLLLQGVPDQIAAGGFFEAQVTIDHSRTSGFRAESVKYVDESIRPVGIRTAKELDLGTLEAGVEGRLTAKVPYQCVPPPDSGSYEATIVFNNRDLAQSFAPFFGGGQVSAKSDDSYSVQFVISVLCPLDEIFNPTPTPLPISGCGGLDGIYRGNGNCGISSLKAADGTETSIRFKPFGENSSATFEVNGNNATSTSSNLKILGETGYKCSLNCASNGSFRLHCEKFSDSSDSCDQNYAP